MDFLGGGFGLWPVADGSARQDELVGLLGMGHDNAQPDDYCAAVGVFRGFHGYISVWCS